MEQTLFLFIIGLLFVFNVIAFIKACKCQNIDMFEDVSERKIAAKTKLLRKAIDSGKLPD